VLSLKLPKALPQDVEIDRPGSQCPGLLATHLNELKPPRDLGEAWVN
jgi:hypothetical protein